MSMFGTFKKALPSRKPKEVPIAPEVLYLSDHTSVDIIQWNDHIAAEAAMRHPIVFRALNKLAESAQQVRFRVEEDPYSSKRVSSRELKDLQALLDRPNDELPPAMFRYWMALNWYAYGRVPIKVGFGAVDRKKPNGLYPLEARYVEVKLSDRGVPKEYEYGDGDRKEVYVSRQSWTPSSKNGFVDQIWKPRLRGHQHRDEINTPLRAIGLPAQVIKALLIRAIETAEGHANAKYLVTCEKSLTTQQKEALKQHLNREMATGGPEAGGIPVIHNAGNLEIHKLDNDLSDIHSKMPADDMARLIFGAFGIPIALAGMGAADGAKFAGNYIESRQSFWQDTIIPGVLNPLCHGLTMMLCPEGLRVVPELNDIPALQEARIHNMTVASKINFLTTTEKREIFGLEPTNEIPEAPEQMSSIPLSEERDNEAETGP